MRSLAREQMPYMSCCIISMRRFSTQDTLAHVEHLLIIRPSWDPFKVCCLAVLLGRL